MKSSRRLIVLLAAAGILVANLPAHASKPKLRTSRFYIDCSQDAKLQNLPVMMSRAWPSWSSGRPDASIYDGGGCLQYENSMGDDDEDHPFDIVYRGTFKGNVDRVTAEAYLTPPSQANNVLVWIRLIVDGRIRYFSYPNTPVDLVLQRADEAALRKVSFTFIGLGLAKQSGYGTKTRSFSIAMDTRQSNATLWHWGSREASASVVFNPKEPERTELITH